MYVIPERDMTEKNVSETKEWKHGDGNRLGGFAGSCKRGVEELRNKITVRVQSCTYPSTKYTHRNTHRLDAERRRKCHNVPARMRQDSSSVVLLCFSLQAHTCSDSPKSLIHPETLCYLITETQETTTGERWHNSETGLVNFSCSLW